jgi:murein DD-endopeptidase MepM/ murein hydrolase activator NlpD
MKNLSFQIFQKKSVFNIFLIIFILLYPAVTTLYSQNSATDFYLSFPLPNQNPYNVTINSVFDHSMSNSFYPDGVVIAYTGEKGENNYNQSNWYINFEYGDLYGFKNSTGTNYIINGNYSGGGEPGFLFYDGHPGFDYRTTDQSPDGKIDVLAAADGDVVFIGCFDPLKSKPTCFGTIEIDHKNGYKTLYIHLSKAKVIVGQSVVRNQVIGTSGDIGSKGAPHLHFEVRKNVNGTYIPIDPYGWEGNYSDPYDNLNNITNNNLWSSQQPPTPNIKANNSDNPVTIKSTDSLSLTIELDPGGYLGTDADWWLAADTPFDWFYYICDKDGCSWKVNVPMPYQCPLFNFPQTEVLNTFGLPDGDYTFYFGIEADTDNTGNKQFIYDEINIIALPTGYSISGEVTLKKGTGLSGITMSLTGPTSKSTTTDTNGDYKFTDLNNGNYTLSPSKSGYTFSPTKLIFTINNNDTKQNFTADAIIKTSILTINKSGNGYGTVNSSPAGINCGNTCSASFSQGSTLNLTATPAFNSIFTGWSGACSVTGTCSVTMDADKTATATFQTNNPPTATITHPLNGDTYTQFQSITFNGSGYDLKDGTLDAGSLVWTSNIDGQIGTGTSFTKNDLSIGTHTVTLVATDSDGATGNNNVSILISFPTTDQITLGLTSLNFGDVQVGACETVVFAIQHISGTGPATGTVSTSSNPPFSISPSSSFSVSNGSVANITVQFCPTSSGTFSGTATVSSSATFTGTKTVTLTGTGSSPTNPPTVTTGPYQVISSTSVQLFGTVNSNGLSTTGWFQYGTSTSYGSTTNSQSIGVGNSSVQMLPSISNLIPGTTYHFRAVGQNSVGTNYGNDMIFTTPAPSVVKPTVTTTSATSITTSGATLNGTVNPNGTACTSWFQYGTSTSYGSTTNSQSIGSGNSSVPMNHSISNLAPNTTYHFRAVSQNSVGTNYGNDMSFTISVSSESISTPNTPSGNSSGNAGTTYSYSVGGTSSNLGHSIQYYFDWGDGTNSGWSSSSSISHSWSAGQWGVKAKARCSTHTSVESAWSSLKTVNISAPQPTERIINGHFSSGTSGWSKSGDFWIGSAANYRSSPNYAAGGVDSSGYPKNNALGSMYQTITIPSNATSATLSFWYNISSSDSNTTPYDVLNVTVQNSSGGHLASVAIYSNTNANGSYTQKTYDLLSFKGQTIRINFLATSDNVDKTVFRIDDVSLMADGN